MAGSRTKDIEIHGWGCLLGLLFALVGSFIISFLIPLAAPAIGMALIVSGVVTYRQSADVAVRAVAVAAIAGGVLIILTIIVGGMSFIGVRIGTTSNVPEILSATPIPPKP